MSVRTPSEVRACMEPLARLPVFFALEGRRAVIAGATAAAAWKAELLSAAGASVDVYACDLGDDMTALAANPPRGRVLVHRRAWVATDFAGAAIAVGACEGDADAARFAEAARAAGVPVNVVDRPAHCDFSFGAIVNRSPLVIGISTDGAAPVFAQAIRARLQAAIPHGFARWAEAAARWRERVQSSGLSPSRRRGFWQRFADIAIANPNRAPEPADCERLFAAVAPANKQTNAGSVALVGAGPGDPELLTLRAVRALQSADVILFDDLVSAEVLDFARREAKKMLVGKTGHGPSCLQDDINALMVSLAKSGKRVVRLKGGDPMIFGRGDEEIAACRGSGIAVEVVPGVTAAQAAASRLQVSLTHRNKARRMQYVTGHASGGRLPADIDWRSLADPSATTAIYMPVRTLDALVEKVIAAGLDPSVPAVAIAAATRPEERWVAAPLAELPGRLRCEGLNGPVLVLIGSVVEGMRDRDARRGRVDLDPRTLDVPAAAMSNRKNALASIA